MCEVIFWVNLNCSLGTACKGSYWRHCLLLDARATQVLLWTPYLQQTPKLQDGVTTERHLRVHCLKTIEYHRDIQSASARCWTMPVWSIGVSLATGSRSSMKKQSKTSGGPSSRRRVDGFCMNIKVPLFDSIARKRWSSSVYNQGREGYGEIRCRFTYVNNICHSLLLSNWCVKAPVI